MAEKSPFQSRAEAVVYGVKRKEDLVRYLAALLESLEAERQQSASLFTFLGERSEHNRALIDGILMEREERERLEQRVAELRQRTEASGAHARPLSFPEAMEAISAAADRLATQAEREPLDQGLNEISSGLFRIVDRAELLLDSSDEKEQSAAVSFIEYVHARLQKVRRR